MIQRFIAMAWLSAAFAATAVSAPITNGAATAVDIRTNAANGIVYAEFTLGTNGIVEVVPFAPDVVRVRFHFAGLFEREEVAIAKPFSNWPSFSAAWTNYNGTNIVIETSELKVSIVLSNRFLVHFYDKSGYDLSLDSRMEYDPQYVPSQDVFGYEQIVWPSGSASLANLPTGFKLKAVREMPTNEAYFGLGDFAGPLNRRGYNLQGLGQDTFQWEEFRNPKYVSLPFVYGVRPAATNRPASAYGIFFHNPVRPVFKMTGSTTYSFEAGDDQMDYFFFGGGSNHTMEAVLNRYSELTGRPFMMPKWGMGYHHSRNANDINTQPGIESFATEFRQRDYPLDAIYLDINAQISTPQNQQLSLNSTFTNVPQMVAICSNLGVRLVPIIEPLLTSNDPFYAEALTNLYFLKKNDLSTHVGTNFLGLISWIDFSIADARAWWLGKITNYLATNRFDAIWNDLNEPNENGMPRNVLHYLDGRYGGGLVTNDTRKWHINNKNAYSVTECSLSFDALRASYPDRRPFVLSRAGWPGIARYSAGWSGDNVASYEHLRHNIRAGLSVMISGQPYFGHDIGGFSGNVTPNLLTRWMEMAVLQPVFRNHTFSANREPWLFGSPNSEWNRRWMKFRYEVLPFLYSLTVDAATNGLPINLPTVFEFPGDVNTYSLNEYDFLVGKSLLAAPVYVQSDTKRSVYLPFGANWYFWQDDAYYLGGQTIEVPASMGTLPMFVREGAIIPLGPAMDYADEVQPDSLDIHVWPRSAGTFTLYEDDGISTNHESGIWARTRFDSTPGSNSLLVTAQAKQGPYDTGSRDYYFVLHAVSNPVSVTINGVAASRFGTRDELESDATNGWSYLSPGNLLTVKTPDSSGAITVQVDFDPLTDTDADGMPDSWEIAYSGSATALVATNNPDGDARNNLQEYTARRSPLVADSFGSIHTNMAVAGTMTYWDEAARNMKLVSNGLWATVIDLTGWTNIEFKFVANDQWTSANWGDDNPTNTVIPLVDIADHFGANILATGAFASVYTFTFNESNLAYSVRASSTLDSDRDGLNDAWEFQYGFDPMLHADSALDAEGDGLANSNEFAIGSHPLQSDTDGDGSGDASEYIAGTQATNALSFFVLSGHELNTTNGILEVRWGAVTGRFYDVYATTNLLENGWNVYPPFTNLSGSGPLSISDTNPVPQRDYRVKVRLQ